MTTTLDSASSAPRSQRLLWWSIVGGCVLVLAAAAAIEPDARGYGTHTQLGLPPCGLPFAHRIPLPRLRAHHRFRIRHPGALVARGQRQPARACAVSRSYARGIPLGMAAALRGWSLDAAIERFSLNRWGLALAGCAAAVWIVRFAAAF